MPTPLDTTLGTFDQLSRQQLGIYAEELHEHIREERRVRRQLEERNQQLERRVRELNALNAIIQRHLERCDLDTQDRQPGANGRGTYCSP